MEGIAMGYAIIPNSTFYTAGNFLNLRVLTNFCVSRFISMPVARWVTNLGGRDAYAAMQLGMALLMLLGCVRVAPAARLLLAHGQNER